MTRSFRSESAWSRFQRIQRWKDNAASTNDGINYARVVATYLYRTNLRQLAKMTVYGLLFRSSVSRAPDRSRRMLIFYAHRHKERSDYDYIVDYLADAADGAGDLLEHRDIVSFTQVFRAVRYFAPARQVARGFGAGLLETTALTVLIARFMSDRSSLDTLVAGRAVVVTFSDALPWDNLIAQLGKLAGARTVTAQHGQYRVLGPENVTADAEAYANFISDTMLAWGEATVDQFVRAGVSHERLVVVGWIRSWPNIVDVSNEERPRIFGVILNGENGHASNYELMKTAEQLAIKLDMKYVARAHPTFVNRGYLDDAPNCIELRTFTTGEYSDRVLFSLANSSSAALEILILRRMVYIVDDGTVAQVFRLPGLVFSPSALLDQVRSDLRTPEFASERLAARRTWFNDDSNQLARVVAGISGGNER